MRIDRSHLPWLWITVASTAVCTALYILHAESTGVSGGGTPVGILFGSLALGCMIFAALLSLRKRFPIWRIGKTRLWLKAHLWLGFLALPLVLLHAAFRAHGLLAIILMTLTIVVVLSGVYGAYLQHTLPTRMFREVKFETIYDQMGVVRGQLLKEADNHALSLTQMLAPGRGAGATVVLTMLTVAELGDEVSAFDRFYAGEVQPFLPAEPKEAKKLPLSDRTVSREQFDGLRRRFPPAAWPALNALEEVCEEKRQLDKQVRLHHWLHTWLLVHLPLSAALLLLACLHAVIALHY